MTKKRLTKKQETFCSLRRTDGAALVVALGLIAVAGILLSAMPALGLFQSVMVKRQHSKQSAYYAARGGVEAAVAALSTESGSVDHFASDWRQEQRSEELDTTQASYTVHLVSAEELLNKEKDYDMEFPEGVRSYVKELYTEDPKPALNINFCTAPTLYDRLTNDKWVEHIAEYMDVDPDEMAIADRPHIQSMDELTGLDVPEKDRFIEEVENTLQVHSSHIVLMSIGQVEAGQHKPSAYISAVIERAGDDMQLVYWQESG